MITATIDTASFVIMIDIVGFSEKEGDEQANCVTLFLNISSFAPLKWGEAVESIGDSVEISSKLRSWIAKISQGV
jgi:hypothetical protein